MPRCARVKSLDSIYHVMVRGVGDIRLFKTELDKNYYLKLVKKYMGIHLFKVYAYCLMDTHAHLIIDSNGADISSFMHVINQCYAQYYNKTYNRIGHVFGDRFKSRIVTDERYLLVLSGYIHNNPKDIEAFKENVELYKFSSLGVYLGINSDYYKLLDVGFIMQHFSKKVRTARKLYRKFVGICTDIDLKDETEFNNEKSEYRSERKILIRNYTFDEITLFVSKYTEGAPSSIYLKYKSKTKLHRALSILLMHSLGNLSYKQICGIIGNTTISQVSKLSSEGYNIISKNPAFKNIINALLNESRNRIS